MTIIHWWVLSGIVALIPLAWVAGRVRGRASMQRHADRAERYLRCVDDVDRWCGHDSIHARVIAAHVKAHGEGANINAGTPHLYEACTVPGLRDQLKRIDKMLSRGD